MKTFQKSSEIYESGMAIGVYNIQNDKVTYRWRDEYFTVPLSHPFETAVLVDIEVRVTPVSGLREIEDK